MPPREDIILFLDLETTGTNEEKDNIIEVGMVMLADTEGYPEIGSFQTIVRPSDEAYQRMVGKDVVRQMHKDNGLLDEIDQLVAGMDESRDPELVDLAILKWLSLFTGTNNTHIPYGGSGVMHFDRRFIDRYLPQFSKRITFWAYDVGVMRRSFRKAGAKFYSDDAKTHRALDDARVHADEWRFYQRVFGGLERA